MKKNSALFGFSVCATFALLLLISCNTADKKNASTNIAAAPKDTNTNKELEYIGIRNSTINYFKSVKLSSDPNKFSKQETDSLKHLENILKEILKGCKIANISEQGKINLETLIEGMGFGQLDGLREQKKSLTIFCTSRKLFNLYFEKKINQFDSISPDELENIFQSTFESDAAVNNLTSYKITNSKGYQAYGMLGLITQNQGPYPPNSLFVLVFADKYVYMAQKDLKEGQIKKTPKCQAAWDSINSIAEKKLKIYDDSNLKDTAAINNYIKLEDSAWNNYRKCYQETFKKTEQFNLVKKKINEIVQGIEN